MSAKPDAPEWVQMSLQAMPRLCRHKLSFASKIKRVVMSCDGLQSERQTLTVVVVLCLLRLNELRDCLANLVIVWLLCYLRHT